MLSKRGGGYSERRCCCETLEGADAWKVVEVE